jgi:hypothetical protein
MEETKPFESYKQFSVLKKTLLYVNVTFYRMLVINGRSWRYDDRTSSVFFTMLFYYTVVKYILHDHSSFHLYRVLAAAGVFHLTINFAFYKDIEMMVKDYYSYYSKPFFYWFLIVIAVDILGMILIFNDMIGK